MVERRGAERNARLGVERFARAERLPAELGSHPLARDRRAGLDQHGIEDRFERAVARFEMPRPEAQTAGGVEQGSKMFPAPDVVVVGVAEEEIGVERRALGCQRVGERDQAGTRVEQQAAPGTAHLQARGVAAIARRGRPGAGDGAPHPPEADEQAVALPHCTSPFCVAAPSVPQAGAAKSARFQFIGFRSTLGI